MLSRRQQFRTFSGWLTPLLLTIFLVSSCQFVPKRYYLEAETKSTLAQRAAATQKERIQQLKEENAKLTTTDTALRNELVGLSTVIKQIKDVRRKEKMLIKKTVAALKQEKAVLQQRFIALQNKYAASQRKNLKRMKSTEGVVSPQELTPDSKLKLPPKPLSAPKPAKALSGNDPAISEPQPSTSPPTETQRETMPAKIPSSVQEPKLSRHENEKDLEQPEAHEKQLAQNQTQNTSSIGTSSPAGIDVNTGTAEDIMTHLGLSADIAEGIIANRPYRFPAELVLKGVITKKTYNKIKEKVVAAP